MMKSMSTPKKCFLGFVLVLGGFCLFVSLFLINIRKRSILEHFLFISVFVHCNLTAAKGTFLNICYSLFKNVGVIFVVNSLHTLVEINSAFNTLTCLG